MPRHPALAQPTCYFLRRFAPPPTLARARDAATAAPPRASVVLIGDGSPAPVERRRNFCLRRSDPLAAPRRRNESFTAPPRGFRRRRVERRATRTALTITRYVCTRLNARRTSKAYITQAASSVQTPPNTTLSICGVKQRNGRGGRCSIRTL